MNRAPQAGRPLPDLPDLSDPERKAIDIGKKFAAMQGKEVYHEFVDALYDRVFATVMVLAGARTGDEALRECGVLSATLEAIGIVPGQAQFGVEAERAFTARYESAAESQRAAQIQSIGIRGRAAGAAFPAT